MKGFNKLLLNGSRLSKLFKLGGGGGQEPPAQPAQDTSGPHHVPSPQTLSEAADSSLGSQYSLDSLDDRNVHPTCDVPPSPGTFLRRVASIRTLNPMDGSMYSCAGEELSDSIFGGREPTPKCAEDQFSLFEADVLPEEEIHIVQHRDTNQAASATLSAGPIRQHAEAGVPCQLPQQNDQVRSLNSGVHKSSGSAGVGKDTTSKQCAVVGPNQLADRRSDTLTVKSEVRPKNAPKTMASPGQAAGHTVEEHIAAGKDPKRYEAAQSTIAEVVPLCEDVGGEAPRMSVVPGSTARLSDDAAPSNISPQTSGCAAVTTFIEQREQLNNTSNGVVVMSSNGVERPEERQIDAGSTVVTVVGDASGAEIDQVNDLVSAQNEQGGAFGSSEMPAKRKKNKRSNRRAKSLAKNRDRSDHGKSRDPEQCFAMKQQPQHNNNNNLSENNNNNNNQQANMIKSEATAECSADNVFPEILQPPVTQIPIQLPLTTTIVNDALDTAISAGTTAPTASSEAAVSELTPPHLADSRQVELASTDATSSPYPDDSNAVPAEQQVHTDQVIDGDKCPSIRKGVLAVKTDCEKPRGDTDTPNDINGLKRDVSPRNLANINNSGTSENDAKGGSGAISKNAADTDTDGSIATTVSGVAVNSTDGDGLTESAAIALVDSQTDSLCLESLPANSVNERDRLYTSVAVEGSMAPCDSAETDRSEAIQMRCVPSAGSHSKAMLVDQQDASTPTNETANVEARGTLVVDTTYRVLEEVASELEKGYSDLVGPEIAEGEPDNGLGCGSPRDMENAVQKTSSDTCDEASGSRAYEVTAIDSVPHMDTTSADITTKTEDTSFESVKASEEQDRVAPPHAEVILSAGQQHGDSNSHDVTDACYEQAQCEKTEHQLAPEPIKKTVPHESIKEKKQRQSNIKMPSSGPSEGSDAPVLEPPLDPMEEFTRLEKAIEEAEKACHARSSLDKPSMLHREKSSSPLPSRRQIVKPKRMDQRENSFGKVERPSKMLREHSMSPINFRRVKTPADSLDTTADSISPDNSLVQDITYDIVDQERVRPSKTKKFTFGLDIPTSEPPAMVSSTVETGPIVPGMALGASYIVEKNVSEESLPLASELENLDEGHHPRSPSAQLSVSVLTSSNPQEAVKPLLVDLSELVGASLSIGHSNVKCMESDLVSFAYLADDKTVVAIDKALQDQPAGACRVTVSYRLEPLDGPDTLPSDVNSSYVRSLRLEALSHGLSGSPVGSPVPCLSGRHGQKPSAIVSPMKPAMVSRPSQTEVLHGDALEGYRLLAARSSGNVVDDLRRALTTYAEVVTVLKKRLDDFSKNNSRSTEALAKELLTEKTRNHKLEQTVNNLERTIQSTMSRMGEVRSANGELREVVQSQLDMLTEYKTQIEDLAFEKSQLTASRQELEEATEQLLRRERHTLDKQAALLRAQMEMKNMEIERLQQEARIMREQLSSCQKVINDLQQY